jgi:hypothetical protein
MKEWKCQAHVKHYCRYNIVFVFEISGAVGLRGIMDLPGLLDAKMVIMVFARYR